jgi:hypothetical protein
LSQLGEERPGVVNLVGIERVEQVLVVAHRRRRYRLAALLAAAERAVLVDVLTVYLEAGPSALSG